MQRMYLMSAVTTIVAVAVVSQRWATRDSGLAGPGLRQRLYDAAAGLSRRLGRILNNWVAAMIAYREHQATRSALGKLSNSELKDFAVYRGRPGSAFHWRRNEQPGDEGPG